MVAFQAMNAQAILNFIEELGTLKNLPRMGWLLHGIKNCESVAEHCYRTSVLAMVLADFLVDRGVAVNVEKVMRIALLHDLSETRIGDLPFPALEYIPEEVKENSEKKACRSLLEPLGKAGEKYFELWQEFEDNKSIEGKIVRAADKLELMIQVFDYEKVGCRSLDRFWENPWNRRDFDLDEIVPEIMKLLEERRKSF